MVGAFLLLLAIYFIAVFPTAGLLKEYSSLQLAKTQLASLQRSNERIDSQIAQLSTPAVIARIAKEKYGLVVVGQKAYVVVPQDSPATPKGH